MAEKTDLEKILSNNVDVKNRRIYFGDLDDSTDGDRFTWVTVEQTIRALKYLESLNKKPIELHMSSPGGDALNMLRLYDHIMASSCQIRFFGGGFIASSASYIMCGCDERFLYPNTRVMVHKGNGGMDGDATFTDSMIETKQCQKLDDDCNTIYANNSKMPFEFWHEFTKRDLWLTAEETIQLGLADKIVEPKKRGNLRRSRIAIMNRSIDKKEMARLIRELSKRIDNPKTFKIVVDIPKEECDKELTVEKEKENPKAPDESSPLIVF